MRSTAKFALIVAALLALYSCNKPCRKCASDDTCIQSKINALKAEASRNPRAEVWEYIYNGKTVYYIPASCCDRMSELYDAQCNFICSPDGGYTGGGDGHCSDFFSARSKGKLIWQDGR